MCGRFILRAPFSELARLYSITNNLNLERRHNIPQRRPLRWCAPIRAPAAAGR